MPKTRYLNAKNGIEILNESGTTQLLTGNFDPSIEGLAAEIGSIFLCNSAGGGLYNKTTIDEFGWALVASGTVTKKFLDLMDVPGSYLDHIGSLLSVNTEGNGLEFISTIDGGDFI